MYITVYIIINQLKHSMPDVFHLCIIYIYIYIYVYIYIYMWKRIHENIHIHTTSLRLLEMWNVPKKRPEAVNWDEYDIPTWLGMIWHPHVTFPTWLTSHVAWHDITTWLDLFMLSMYCDLQNIWGQFNIFLLYLERFITWFFLITVKSISATVYYRKIVDNRQTYICNSSLPDNCW